MVLHSFYWRHPAGNVKVTGDFDEWKGTLDMQKTADGTFVKVVDLPADSKVFYKFVVDGQWLVDHDAQVEGTGVTQNNYILTESEPVTSSRPVMGADGAAASAGDDLPALGAGAVYTNSSSTAAVPATSSVEKNPPVDAFANSKHNPAEVPAISGIGSAKAEEQPASSILDRAQASIPTSEELEKKADELVAGASAAVAAGLAAGAAALGLSFGAGAKEVKTDEPVTEPSAEVPTPSKAIASPSASVAQATEVPSSTVGKVAAISQTSELEQAAVQAATLAATNAHNAAGLGGLSGVAPTSKSIVDAGSLGFTSVGTAINKELGIVGSSKIVQGLDEAKPIEETRTAQIDAAAGASAQVFSQTDGAAKVQKLGEHAVLAEVTVGGAALGTAVVTDSTITKAADLNIPPQAAEHLDRDVSPPTLSSQGVTEAVAPVSANTTVAAPAPVAPVAQSDLAPPLDGSAVTPSAATLTTAAPSAVTVPAAAVIAPSDAAVSRETPAPVTTAAASAAPAAQAVSNGATTTSATLPTNGGLTPPVPAAATASKTLAASSARKASTTQPPASAATGPAPSTLTKQSSIDSKTAAGATGEKPKKKNNLLRRMRSMFKSKD